LIKHNDQYYDSLGLAIVRTFLDNPPLLPEFASLGAGKNYAGLESLKLGKQHIPVDDEVSAYVPYRGEQKSFEYVSATDVLTNKALASSLKDKIVLVGTSAPGLNDLRSAPMQKFYPGVEVHANLIAGILDNSIKQRPAYTNAVELLLLLAAGLLLAFSLPILNPLKATLMTFAVLIAVLLINFFAWQSANLILPIASLLFMIGLIYLVNMSYGFFVESRSKRQLAGLFGQYVPPELVDEMSKNPEKVNMEPDNREMSVLFTDIRGFTSISEGLNPQQLSEMMNEILSPMTQIIHQHRGTVDKYMGDAIMAFWGAPLADNNHAQHALKAAMDMAAALKKLNEKFATKGWPAIQMGIGVNCGTMAVGNMGSSFRMAYTVMGDNVNLGSRLEALTKNYGVGIIVSEYVKAQTHDMVYRDLDAVRVKGKEAPVTIFEPLGAETEVSQEQLNALKLHQQALKLYRNQQWDLAEMQWINLQNSQPHDLYALYIERIQLFRKIPPAKNWDGVYNFETK
jgi:adenylate cyclase